MTVTVGTQTLGAAVSGSTWSVSLPAALAEGSYNVQAKATDTAGNSGSDSTANELTVDTTPPVVLSITKVDPDPNTAATVHYTITFSEAVSGVDTGDLVLAASPTMTFARIMSVWAVDASHYSVTVSTGTGDGTLRLDLVDNNSIHDMAGNLLGGPVAGDGSFTRRRIRSTPALRRYPPLALPM